MKKIIFSLCLLAFSVSLFGQVSSYPKVRKKQNFVDSTYFTKDVSTSLGNLKNSQVGVFNVLDYGVHANGVTSDVSHIQSAINAAHALYSDATAYGGGTVVIPAGIYYIDSPDTLKSSIEIKIDAAATFIFPSGYTGSMWFSNSTLFNCYVHGGKYGIYGDPRTWTAIDINSPADANYVMFNRFADMWIYDSKIGVNLSTTNDGWINGNTFRDIVIFRPLSGIRTRQGAGSHGLSENKFVNMEIQLLPNTSKFAIDSLTGYRNQFVNVSAYDVGGTTKEIFINTTGLKNMFIGCSFEKSYTFDNGADNLFLGGEYTNVPQLEYAIGAVVAVTGITRDMLAPIMIANLGAAIDISANPQIAAGSSGQIITIIGDSNTNTLTLNDTNGLALAGVCVLGNDDTITLVYSTWSGLWTEISRANN
jgi:hypothetical protein